ncbi:MAG: hypothetical protein ACE5G5_00120 [Candidatus Methylomirabilales bacterium]
MTEVRRISRTILFRTLIGLLLWLSVGSHAAVGEDSKLILALGDDSYISAEAVKAWTNAEVRNELGERDLLEFAVVILSNVPYAAVPAVVQERLSEFMSEGGSLLITGGPNSFGSGGYQSVASYVPFEIRDSRDWRSFAFKPILPVQEGHPILQGVTFRTIGTFNDLNPKRGEATEIAQYAGGATAIATFYPSPLIAEQQVGQGTVIGVAFDLGKEINNGWADGNRFVRNVIVYLVDRSPLNPKPKGQKEQ